MAEMKRRVGREEAEANFEGVVMRKGVWGTEKKERGLSDGVEPFVSPWKRRMGKNRTGNIKIRIGKGREQEREGGKVSCRDRVFPSTTGLG